MGLADELYDIHVRVSKSVLEGMNEVRDVGGSGVVKAASSLVEMLELNPEQYQELLDFAQAHVKENLQPALDVEQTARKLLGDNYDEYVAKVDSDYPGVSVLAYMDAFTVGALWERERHG